MTLADSMNHPRDRPFDADVSAVHQGLLRTGSPLDRRVPEHPDVRKWKEFLRRAPEQQVPGDRHLPSLGQQPTGSQDPFPARRRTRSRGEGVALIAVQVRHPHAGDGTGFELRAATVVGKFAALPRAELDGRVPDTQVRLPVGEVVQRITGLDRASRSVATPPWPSAVLIASNLARTGVAPCECAAHGAAC